MKPLGALFGFWAGVNLLAVPVAAGLIYLFTGKLPVPGQPGQLVDIDEAEARLRELAERAEGEHE